ncbi:SDR family oxidoreductase [Granulicella sp. S156]|uniref:SDR family oxidoreductase n=1 Tax=Granulicella sp. S156 TaxID=1747224 RepID=UPI00131E598D|nr:SDR family oxidoreductase [Granulicella sp. S156]
MRVFVTGAAGFMGSFLVPQLIQAGHHVVGLCRSDAGAEALVRAGAEVVRGDVNDLYHLRTAAQSSDGIIHTAFHHDFANIKQSSENDRKVIETLGAVVKGSDRPLVVTSGTGLVRSKSGGIALETDPHLTSDEFPRGATEEASDALIDSGAHVVVVRLPQVHDDQKQGRISLHVDLALKKGWVAYVADGANRVPAVHVSDAAQLFRLALERGEAGAHYHAVAEEGIAMREVAEAIGDGLRLPVKSIPPDAALEYFGAIAQLATIDLAASGAFTRQKLAWIPSGPGLLTDLRNMRHRENSRSDRT